MPIPVYINQKEAGTLTLTRDGLYTIIEAEAPGGGGLVRLWAHGDGESAYLGVMEPRDGGLHLRRRLSRRELAAFPNPIAFASDRENDPNNKHKTVDIMQNDGPENADKEAGEAPKTGERPEEAPEKAPEKIPEEEPEERPQQGSLQNNQTDYSACPWPAAPPEEGLLWYRRADGSLVAFDGVSSLVAIPSRLRGEGPRGAERVIEGKK